MNLLKKFNVFLLLFPILIFSLSYVVLSSTAPERAREQLMFFLIGYTLFVFVTFVDYNFYKISWKYVYTLVLVILIVTLLFGETRMGSTRWINFGIFSLQTSEIVKVGIIIFTAGYVSSDKESLRSLKKFIKLILIALPLIVLVLMQPDLGTTFVLFSVFLGILIYAGLSKFYLLAGIILAGIFSAPLWSLLQEYQKFRILVFLNPSLDLLGRGYNIVQALIAVGSGGILGKGYGRGTQTHLNFLPVYWTDFIVAAFAEEWGLLGITLLVSLYVVFLLVTLYCAYRTRDFFAELLVVGIFFMFLVQFTVNVGMNLGLLPVTGITLPFFSHGGSSMIISFFLLGIVGNVWMNRRVKA